MSNSSGFSNWFEKYKKTKEYKDNIREFNRKLYFNTRYRNNFRSGFEKIQKDALNALEQIETFEKNDIQTRKAKLLWESMLDLSSNFLEKCREIEEYLASLKIEHSRFEVYKKIKGKAVVFKCFFYKNIEKRNKINYLVLPSGLIKRKSAGQIVRKRLSLGKYDYFDKGKFSQTHKNFFHIMYVFKGDKTYKLKVTQRGKIKDNIWAELVN